MYAITLWPEWAFCIAHLDKRVENRSWKAPSDYCKQRIAIHAGAHIGGRKAKVATAEGLEAITETAFGMGWDLKPTDRAFADGSIEILVDRWNEKEGAKAAPKLLACSAVVATAMLVGSYRGYGDPWADPESWNWLFEDVCTLDPPITGVVGSRGLWPLPPHVNDQVLKATVHQGMGR